MEKEHSQYLKDNPSLNTKVPIMSNFASLSNLGFLIEHMNFLS